MGKKNTDTKPKNTKNEEKQNEAKQKKQQKTNKIKNVEITSEDKKQKKIRKEKAQKIKEIEEESQDMEEDPNILQDHEEKETLEDLNQKFENCLKETKSKLTKNTNLIQKAIKCLKEIISKRYENSLNILSNEEEELFYLNFVLGKFPLKYSLRPVSVPLEKSLFNLDMNTRICLFVKDPKQDFKELEIDFPIKVKVIDIQSLKLKYSRFQDRRNLLKQYDLFLCDYKIYFVLKKLLGKPFYVHRKYPVPLKLNYEDKDEIRNEILRSVSNGVFYMTNGPNYAFKVARFSMDKEDILKNIMKSLDVVVSHILKWGVAFEDLKSISLKGANTLELPIFNQLTKEEINAFETN